MKQVKVYVLIPDRASGDYFNNVLRQHRIDTEYEYHYIHPRVINNQLTTSHDVIDDMNAIFSTFKDKTQSVVIACNTLQLWLPDINPEYTKNVKVYTTFEACDWKFGADLHKPLWLGTTPLVERTHRFPTLLSLGRPDLQDDVQEIIWRTKMFYGDEVITAYDFVKQDQALPKPVQQQKINALRHSIITSLQSLGITRVILGCTELPMQFDTSVESTITWIDPAEVLAEYVKHQSVIIFFAGGTISSLANADGALVGGHVFNLIEKLSEAMPGSYRQLNITKDDILFTGLSENIMPNVWEHIWRNLETTLFSEPARIVITHGTDAMEQTARFLHRKMLTIQPHPTSICLTGSNLAPSEPNTDAWDNLRFAINAAVPASTPVTIAFGNRLVPATFATKMYTNGSNHFVATTSPEYLQHLDTLTHHINHLNQALSAKAGHDPDFSGIMTYAVNRVRTNHDAFLHAVSHRKLHAVLMKLYHSGTANTSDRNVSIAALIKQLVAQNIVCFGATETGEPTDLHLYETSVKLRKAGLVPLYNMIFEVAYHKLALLPNQSPAVLIDSMLKDQVGEIDERQVIQADIANIKRRYSA